MVKLQPITITDHQKCQIRHESHSWKACGMPHASPEQFKSNIYECWRHVAKDRLQYAFIPGGAASCYLSMVELLL